MMKFRENEEAVSPVIGVILMVAITVILAAVIAAFVFEMSSDMPDTTKNVAISVKAATGNAVMVTIEGGSDLPKLQSMKLTVYTDASTKKDYFTQDTDNFGNEEESAGSNAGQFKVGSVSKSINDVLETGKSRHVIVVGIFNDGTEQKLADTYL